MNIRSIPRRLGFLAVLSAPVVLAQTPLPKDHPPLPAGNREKAARLTEAIGGAADPAAAPAKRNSFIDEHIFGKMERDGIPYAPLTSDAEFFRRIHLDLTGRVGADDDLRDFLASADPAKRDKLIDKIALSDAYKKRWAYWFGDLAMAAANRVGPGGKNIFYDWIYDNVHLNRPYNEVVKDMLTASAASNWYVGPASYVARWVVIGLKCEDTVHEDTSDELAIRSAKHFLGIDLNCVSCHDGAKHLEKINVWLAGRKRDELYRMGAFFGETRVLRRVERATTRDEYSIDDYGPGYDASARTVVRVPRRGEGKVDPVFILTGARPEARRPLRHEFARMVTSHPQFARTAVNLFWAELMGVGIVDPPLDFDLARQDPKNPPPSPWSIQPTHPELLDALAADFEKSGYDLRRLITTIAKSSAYQLSSRFPGEWKDAYSRYYARHFVRRLTAEQVHDSIVQATGLFTGVPIRGTDVVARYATEMRSPEDFKQSRPGLKDINFFLESFGQNNREYSERVNDGDITQAILLMNSPWIAKQVKAQPGGYLSHMLAEGKAPDEAIGRLFERFLNRRPEPREVAMARGLLARDPYRGYEDLQWLLVNKVDFIFNY
ncbi:MAG: DUF1553 domain-containing protein [Bryobacteraceae bacterium]